MNKITTLIFIIVFQFLNAQDFPWKNKCENQEGLSNAEYGNCLLNSTKEAESYFNKLYDSIMQDVKVKMSKAQQNSPELEMLRIYNNNLPLYKKALSDYAISFSAISEAQNIEGSGHTIFQLSKLLKLIEENIEKLSIIKGEVKNNYYQMERDGF